MRKAIKHWMKKGAHKIHLTGEATQQKLVNPREIEAMRVKKVCRLIGKGKKFNTACNYWIHEL
jgi:hypothetical protein